LEISPVQTYFHTRCDGDASLAPIDGRLSHPVLPPTWCEQAPNILLVYVCIVTHNFQMIYTEPLPSTHSITVPHSPDCAPTLIANHILCIPQRLSAINRKVRVSADEHDHDDFFDGYLVDRRKTETWKLLGAFWSMRYSNTRC
jgi:hypothetical protein